MSLSTMDCPSTGKRRRSPNPQEEEVIDLWESMGLNEEKFSAESLISFFRRFKK